MLPCDADMLAAHGDSRYIWILLILLLLALKKKSLDNVPSA